MSVALRMNPEPVRHRPRKRSWRTRFFRKLQRIADRIDRLVWKS